MKRKRGRAAGTSPLVLDAEMAQAAASTVS